MAYESVTAQEGGRGGLVGLPSARKTYADFPVFLTRESSHCQQLFRMPPFLFLDTSRYVIRL